MRRSKEWINIKGLSHMWRNVRRLSDASHRIEKLKPTWNTCSTQHMAVFCQSSTRISIFINGWHTRYKILTLCFDDMLWRLAIAVGNRHKGRNVANPVQHVVRRVSSYFNHSTAAYLTVKCEVYINILSSTSATLFVYGNNLLTSKKSLKP